MSSRVYGVGDCYVKAPLMNVFIGASLALVLQTNYRLVDSVGFGEVGLAAFVLISLFAYVFNGHWAVKRRYMAAFVFPGYILLILLMETILYWLASTDGGVPRDIFAYLLSALLILSLGLNRSNAKEISTVLIVITLLIVGWQYLFGVGEAWYSNRFTGGSKNPNQLALYMSCLLLLILISDFSLFVKVVFSSVVMFFGMKTLSDAYLLSLVVFVPCLVLLLILRNVYTRFILMIFVFLTLAVVLYMWEEISGALLLVWDLADEGGGRVKLYTNGIKAWFSTPLSIIVGNGAGVFSGIDAPFQGAESHNTPIDVLSIGGAIGFLSLYYLAVKNLWSSGKEYKIFVFAGIMGLMVFSFFHLVVRHPIYWFTLYAVAEFLYDENNVESMK